MNKIVIEKKPNKRLFLLNGFLLCSCELDREAYDGFRVIITDFGGIFKQNCNPIYIRKKDFDIVSIDKIKEFLAYHMGKRLGDMVFTEIVEDFGLFHKLKEKVVFT